MKECLPGYPIDRMKIRRLMKEVAVLKAAVVSLKATVQAIASVVSTKTDKSVKVAA